MASARSLTTSFLAVALIVVPAAQAQWVMVARAVSGQVQRIEQQKTAKSGGYDVATVILEAKAEGVYDKALSMLQAHSDQVKITSTDAARHSIKFTDGFQNATLQATSLGPTLTQLIVASDGPDKSGVSIVVHGGLKVCAEMKVDLTQSDPPRVPAA